MTEVERCAAAFYQTKPNKMDDGSDRPRAVLWLRFSDKGSVGQITKQSQTEPNSVFE